MMPKKGYKQTEEHKQKINLNCKRMLGKHHSEKSKQRISRANFGRVVSEDIRQKIERW